MGRKKRNKRKFNDPKVLRATVITNFELNSTGYTQQNVQFNYADALVNNELFQKYSQLYQFFQLGFIETQITPIIYQGTRPPIGYIYFQGNESNIDYSELPNLPGSRKINPNGTTYFKFSRPGRNPDFNYWYDTREIDEIGKMQAKLRFRFSVAWQGLPEELGYHVRIKYHMKFSHVCLFSETKNQIEEIVKIKNEKSTLGAEPNSNLSDVPKYEKYETELSQ